MMSKVFISHSTKDKKFVNQLSNSLITSEIPVWLDTYEIKLGDSLYDKIYSGIEESNFVIIVVSKNFNKSIWTSKEFRAILSKEDRDGKKYLIPIRIDDVDVPLEISDRIYQDFGNNFNNSVKQLTRYLKKESIHISNIPFEERQVLLNFSNLVDLNVEIIKSVLFDLHKHKESEIDRKQIFFNGYSDIDRLLTICEQNVESVAESSFKNQFLRHTKDIEKYIELIIEGVLCMLNQFKSDNNIELMSGSMYWYSRIFLDSIYSKISRYLNKNEREANNLDNGKLHVFALSQLQTFEDFYNVNGFLALDIFDITDSRNCCSINVGEDCSAYHYFKDNWQGRLTFYEAFSYEFFYKYFIPQLVFKHIINKDRQPLLTTFKNYMVGVR